jgi:hypothetical protein
LILNIIVRVMVFNATFNTISVISWQQVIMMEETGVPIENHRSVASHWQALSHMVVSSTPSRSGIRTHHFEHYEHFSMSFKTVVLLNSSRMHRSVDDYRIHDIALYRMVIDVGTETRTNRLQTSYKKGM